VAPGVKYSISTYYCSRKTLRMLRYFRISAIRSTFFYCWINSSFALVSFNWERTASNGVMNESELFSRYSMQAENSVRSWKALSYLTITGQPICTVALQNIECWGQGTFLVSTLSLSSNLCQRTNHEGATAFFYKARMSTARLCLRPSPCNDCSFSFNIDSLPNNEP
jgi:hypothetical protein